MAEFITTKGAAYHLERIISGASRHLTLISPYLQISDVFLQRLHDAGRRGVTTTIVYGKSDLRTGEDAKVRNVRGVRLLYLQNLHAKCYFNETDMIITSMNMFEASEQNREMGIYLVAGEPAYAGAVREAESIIAAAQVRQPTGRVEEARQSEGPFTVFGRLLSKAYSAVGTQGHCIRCGEAVRLDPDRPFCRTCYNVWSVYSNQDYKERFCHECGRSELTSARRPLCLTCFRK
jgi:hypothetical protein